MKSKTTVVFRMWDDEVIALFPEIPASCHDGACQSFMHIGQHCGADYHLIINNSNPATPEEYSNLKQELESLPYEYDLEIRKKISYETHKTRMESTRECQ